MEVLFVFFPEWDALCHLGRRSVVAGTGSMFAGTRGVFQGLDGAEQGPEVGFVALDIRVERPLVARYAVGLFFWLAGVGDGQLCRGRLSC
jgi:hypothetical protein